MGAYFKLGGGSYKPKDPNNPDHAKDPNRLSQEDLRKLTPAKDAAELFKVLLRRPLWPFVGRIKEVFGPPKSAGLHFEFAKGTRDEFVRTVDPETIEKQISPLSRSMRDRRKKSPLIPDAPKRKEVNWAVRRLASLNGLGTSFRQEGIGQSLHVAYNRNECDVHVDRNGFVIRRADGTVHWHLNGLLRHLTVDLLPDKAPWAVASFGYRDKHQRPIVEATLAPWVAVDLPSRTNRGKTDLKIGLLLQGRFDAL